VVLALPSWVSNIWRHRHYLKQDADAFDVKCWWFTGGIVGILLIAGLVVAFLNFKKKAHTIDFWGWLFLLVWITWFFHLIIFTAGLGINYYGPKKTVYRKFMKSNACLDCLVPLDRDGDIVNGLDSARLSHYGMTDTIPLAFTKGMLGIVYLK
jgi:hypothetical protein